MDEDKTIGDDTEKVDPVARIREHYGLDDKTMETDAAPSTIDEGLELENITNRREETQELLRNQAREQLKNIDIKKHYGTFEKTVLYCAKTFDDSITDLLARDDKKEDTGKYETMARDWADRRAGKTLQEKIRDDKEETLASIRSVVKETADEEKRLEAMRDTLWKDGMQGEAKMGKQYQPYIEERKSQLSKINADIEVCKSYGASNELAYLKQEQKKVRDELTKAQRSFLALEERVTATKDIAQSVENVLTQTYQWKVEAESILHELEQADHINDMVGSFYRITEISTKRISLNKARQTVAEQTSMTNSTYLQGKANMHGQIYEPQKRLEHLISGTKETELTNQYTVELDRKYEQAKSRLASKNLPMGTNGV
jgi:hypothetical protein